MTGPRRNTEFRFPLTVNVPLHRLSAWVTLMVSGKQNSLFPCLGPVMNASMMYCTFVLVPGVCAVEIP